MAEIISDDVAVSLDDLPVDILNNIIQYLEAGDLLSTFCVNKRWNAVTSCIAEKKNVFEVRFFRESISETHPFVETFMKSNRNFQCIHFKSCEFLEGSLPFLRKLGSQLKELSIISRIFHNRYNYLLRKCTKLEKLKLGVLDFVDMTFLDNMAQLEQVIFIAGDTESLDTIGTGRIQVFRNLKKLYLLSNIFDHSILKTHFPSADIGTLKDLPRAELFSLIKIKNVRNK